VPEDELETPEFKERLEEATERALEKSESRARWIVYLSFSTALIAVLAAIAALESGTYSNQALIEKNEALLAQAKASDQWAYYQAKGIKSAVTLGSINTWQAAGKTPPPQLSAESARYIAQQDSISQAAKELEHQRDEKSREAEALLSQHESYAASVALLQIAIALGAIAALTRYRVVWYGSVGLGVVAAVLLALASRH